MEQLNCTGHTCTTSYRSGHFLNPPVVTGGLIPAVMLSLCTLLGVPGNIAVLIFRPNFQHLSITSQTLLTNLAVSDLLGLLVLPIWIHSFLYGWTFGLVSCKILSFLVYCSVYGSQLTVTMLSIQRYLQVVQKRSCSRRAVTSILLISLWSGAILLSIPPPVFRQLVKNPSQTTCKPQYDSEAQRITVLLKEVFVGFVTIFLVTFSYIQLYRKVTRAAFFNNPQTLRLVTGIITVFFVLWIPYHITNVLGVIGIVLHYDGLLTFCTRWWNIFGALSFVNSGLNPLLYAFSGLQARRRVSRE